MRTRRLGSQQPSRSSLSPALAVAQTTVEQTIQIGPGGGGGGAIQLPGMMGGPRTFKTGTGRIRGRVLASDGAGPIRRAQVRISGSEVAPKAALTDAEGRFEFRELPAGRFTLQASKSGYVNVQYGQTRPFESGKPIELADKQGLDNADISMPRGSVIAGRIVDEFGDAIPDVSVTAMRQSWQNGRRRLVPSPGRVAQTNDLGQFRLYGLPPGDYYVSASLRSGGIEMMEMELDGECRERRSVGIGAEVRLRPHLLPGHAESSLRRSASRLPPARNLRARTSRSSPSVWRRSRGLSSARTGNQSKGPRCRPCRPIVTSAACWGRPRREPQRTAASRSTACRRATTRCRPDRSRSSPARRATT